MKHIEAWMMDSGIRESLLWRYTLCALRYAHYHLGNGHPDLTRNTGGLPKLTFQNCHFTVKWCAVKFEITLLGTQTVKCLTARPENPVIGPFLELMGNPMKTANHGTIGIKDT